MRKRIILVALSVFILADIGYSFFQFYNTCLDEDIGALCLRYNELMKDPFGISVITENAFYGGTNRFFVHWLAKEYFTNVPFFFQHFTTPINSVYLSCACLKIATHIFLLWLLASFISGTKNIFKYNFIIAVVLITPLFQTSGYNMYMGIINKATSYSVFYAFSTGLLLLYYQWFYFHYRQKEGHGLHFSFHIRLALFAIVLAFNGPLIPGMALIVSLLTFLFFLKESDDDLPLIQKIIHVFKTHKAYLLHSTFLCVLCLYSICIGKNNSENFAEPASFLTRYSRIPMGLYYIFTQKPGMWMLLLMLLLNVFFILKLEQNSSSKKIFSVLKWLGLFTLIYILLLPLGGYRGYRPNIIRVDTFLPVILIMVYIFGVTTHYLLLSPAWNYLKAYRVLIIVFLSIFMWADQPLHETACERDALQKLSQSSEKIVALDNDCRVMTWMKVYDYHQSELTSEMLYKWGITKEKKLFYLKQ